LGLGVVGDEDDLLPFFCGQEQSQAAFCVMIRPAADAQFSNGLLREDHLAADFQQTFYARE